MSSAVSSAAAIRSAGAVSRPSSSPNTTSPGETSTPPHTTVAPRAARDTDVPDRGVVPRAYTGSPIWRRPRRSRQNPSATMPARPRRRASVANSSPNTARVPPFVAMTSTSPGSASASAVITGRWSSSARTVNAGPAMRTSGTIARTAGSTTGSVLSASDSAETSTPSSRSIRSTSGACHSLGIAYRPAAHAIHRQLRNVVRLRGGLRLVREVEDRDHHLHRVVGGLVDGLHVLAVDEEVDPPGPPVRAVHVEFGHVDLQPRRVELVDDRRVPERVHAHAHGRRRPPVR